MFDRVSGQFTVSASILLKLCKCPEGAWSVGEAGGLVCWQGVVGGCMGEARWQCVGLSLHSDGWEEALKGVGLRFGAPLALWSFFFPISSSFSVVLSFGSWWISWSCLFPLDPWF